ncbi:MAG: hypothetical protein RR846_08395 [Oscillospiraceae bacterium]
MNKKGSSMIFTLLAFMIVTILMVASAGTVLSLHQKSIGVVQKDQSYLMAKSAATTVAKEFAKEGRIYGDDWTSFIEKSLFGATKTTDSVTLTDIQLSGYDGLSYTCNVEIKTQGAAAKFIATAVCGDKTSTVTIAAHYTPPGAKGEDIFPVFKGEKGGDFEHNEKFSWLQKEEWQTLPPKTTLIELGYVEGEITVGTDDDKDSFYYITQGEEGSGENDWQGGTVLRAVGTGNIYIFVDTAGEYTFKGVIPSEKMEGTPSVIFVLIGKKVSLNLWGDSYCCVYNTVDNGSNKVDANSLFGSVMSVAEDTGRINMAGIKYIPPKNSIYAGANSASAAHQLGTWEIMQYEK